MSTLESTLFDEVLDFLASSPSAQQIVDFQPSTALQERVRHLLERSKEGTLSPSEHDELAQLGRLNDLVSLLKIRARKKLIVP